MQTKKIILKWPLLLLFFFCYGDLYGESRDCDTDHRHLYLNEGDSLQIAIKAMIAIDAKDIKTQIPTGRLRLFISPKFMEGSFPRIPYRLSNQEIGDSPYCSIFIDISSMRVSTEKEKTTYTYVPSESGGGCGLNIIASSSGSLGGHTDNSCAPQITKILDLDCRQFGGDILTTDKLQTITNPDFLGVKRGCKMAKVATPQTPPGSQQKSAANSPPEVCDPPNILPAPELSKLGDKLSAKMPKSGRKLIKMKLATGNAQDRKEAIKMIRAIRKKKYDEQIEWQKNPGKLQILPIEEEIEKEEEGQINPSLNQQDCQSPPSIPQKKGKLMDDALASAEMENLRTEELKNPNAVNSSAKRTSLLNKLMSEAEQKMTDDELLALDQEEQESDKKFKDYFSQCPNGTNSGKPK